MWKRHHAAIFVLILRYNVFENLKILFKRGQILQIKSVFAEIRPPLYTLVDLQGDKYGAYYYSWQLTKTSKPNYKKDFFLVEKVLDEKIEKGIKYLKVKYLYYGPKFNQWVPASNIQSGSAK